VLARCPILSRHPIWVLTVDCRQSIISNTSVVARLGDIIDALLTIHEQLAKRLRAELVGGRYQPGDPLREESLADRFGVSRATVRQAFGQLVQEGLLVAQRNRGVRAAPPPAEAVRDLLIPIRVQIETFALRAWLPTATPDDFRAWDQLLDRLGEACREGGYALVVERDFDFHRHLVVRGGLADLTGLWTTLITKTHTFYRHQDLAPDDLPAVHAMHAELVRLFRAGDGEAAAAALTEHIGNGAFNEQVRQTWYAGKAKPPRH
jgi:DNA-binding GntR family transcriptional regulator